MPSKIGARFDTGEGSSEGDAGGGRSNATRFFSFSDVEVVRLREEAGELGRERAGLTGRPSAVTGSAAGGTGAGTAGGCCCGCVCVLVPGMGLGALELAVAAAVVGGSESEGRFCFDLVRNPGAKPAKPAAVDAGLATCEAAALVARSAGATGCAAAGSGEVGLSAAEARGSSAGVAAASARSSASSSSKMALISIRGRSGMGLSELVEGPGGEEAGAPEEGERSRGAPEEGDTGVAGAVSAAGDLSEPVGRCASQLLTEDSAWSHGLPIVCFPPFLMRKRRFGGSVVAAPDAEAPREVEATGSAGRSSWMSNMGRPSSLITCMPRDRARVSRAESRASSP